MKTPSKSAVEAAEAIVAAQQRERLSSGELRDIIDEKTGCGELVKHLERTLLEVDRMRSMGYRFEPWFKEARAVLARHKSVEGK